MPRKKDGTPQPAPKAHTGGLPPAKARPQPGRKVKPEDVPMIIASKEPAKAIADRLGCSESLINRYRRNAGVVGVGGRRKAVFTAEQAADPARGQTLETILAKCEERGNCRVWQGSMEGERHDIPMVFHAGKMHPLRAVVAHLTSHPASGKKGVWSCKCKTPGCVAENHLVFRTRSAHLKLKAKARPQSILQLRNLKVAQAVPRKVPLADIPLIKASTEPTKVLAARYDCSEGLIRRYRNKPHATASASPWAGL